MKDKINFIDMNEKLNHEEVYSLFKTHSLKRNKEISEKIKNFKSNMDFFKCYSNKDIKNLLNIFKLKLPENNDEFFSSFKSNIEQYIFCISQIILSIKVFLKTYDILTKIVIKAKNHLTKLKYENKLENYNQDYLFLYLDSLFKVSEKYLKFNNLNVSSLLNENISLFENTPKNTLFTKYSNEYKIDCFSNDEIDSSIYDNQSTPRFRSEPDIIFENQEKKNSSLENSIENNPPIKKDSILTLSKYIFDEKSFTTPQNTKIKFIESPIIKLRKKNTSTKKRIPKTENIDKNKNKRKIFYETNNKNNNKDYYRNLLEMIYKIYKKGLINSEEKIKLKKLTIEKSKKIEFLYYNIYLNSKKDKDTLTTEVK